MASSCFFALSRDHFCSLSSALLRLLYLPGSIFTAPPLLLHLSFFFSAGLKVLLLPPALCFLLHLSSLFLAQGFQLFLFCIFALSLSLLIILSRSFSLVLSLQILFLRFSFSFLAFSSFYSFSSLPILLSLFLISPWLNLFSHSQYHLYLYSVSLKTASVYERPFLTGFSFLCGRHVHDT